MTKQQFDVFLAHSSADKPLIWKIYRQLKDRGLSPWLDEEEIRPGTLFQPMLQQAIREVKTAAVCIGLGGLSQWQNLELNVIINQCLRRGIPVIPVLLPGVDAVPKELAFLGESHSVAFRNDLEDKRALFQLEWGITGHKPTSTPTPPLSLEPINLKWAGDWFVNVGEGDHRTWEDCMKYGFISAGQGAVFSKALKNLKVGGTVYAYISGLGYVGKGEVTKQAVPISDFTVGQENIPLLSRELKAEKPAENSDNLELSEWVVGVKWFKTFSKEEARRFVGAFANPNVVCKLRHKRTLEFLHEEFGNQSLIGTTSGKGNKELRIEWPADWFINIGDGKDHRSWVDCRKYGFISAGQDERLAAAMRKLEVGSTIFAYATGRGYVGFGKVIETAVPISEFTVDSESRPLLEMDLEAKGLDQNSENPKLSEWVARVKWNKTFPKDQARWGTDLFAHRGTLCKLRDEGTLKFLYGEFGIEDDRAKN